MLAVFAGLALALHLAIAAVLVRKYQFTRDVAFIWLGVAVVVWPLLSVLLQNGENVFIERIAHHQSVGFYPFTLVENGRVTLSELVFSFGLVQQLIGVSLLLVAVLYLYKMKTNTPHPSV
jgi:hypothetical protein